MNIIRAFRNIGNRLVAHLGLLKQRFLDYFQIVSKLLSYSIRNRSGIILDLGRGAGWLTKMYTRSCGLIVGIDILFHEEWVESKDPNLVYVVADARFLPIRSEVASAVIALSLLEHVPE